MGFAAYFRQVRSVGSPYDIAGTDGSSAENLTAQSAFVRELFDQSWNLKKILQISARLAKFHTAQPGLSY